MCVSNDIVIQGACKLSEFINDLKFSSIDGYKKKRGTLFSRTSWETVLTICLEVFQTKYKHKMLLRVGHQ